MHPISSCSASRGDTNTPRPGSCSPLDASTAIPKATCTGRRPRTRRRWWSRFTTARTTRRSRPGTPTSKTRGDFALLLHPRSVIRGLDPRIHRKGSLVRERWIAGSSPAMTEVGLQLHRRAHEIALAELNAAMAQNVVGGGAVKIKIRQRVVEKERLARELARGPARQGELDLLLLAAVDVAWLEALEKLDGLADTLLELGNGRLGIGEGRQLRAGEPAAAVDGMVGRRPHLANEGKHVGSKPHVEEHRRFDLLRFRIGRRLVQRRGEAGEELNEDGNGSFVHGDGHGRGPFL